MIEKHDIICISSIDWDFIWQGHQEIMSTLADNGNRVLFIENTGVRAPRLADLPRIRKRISNWFHSVRGIRKKKENLYIYSPIILPFPYSRIASRINRFLLVTNMRRWMSLMGFGSPIVWTFLPTPLALDIARSVDRKLLIYYCIDNFSASSPGLSKIAKSEAKMIAESDIVFVTSRQLEEMCLKFNRNVSLFPFGVNIDIYNKVADAPSAPVPADLNGIKEPIIGYVGGVHKWIDLGLIREVAHNNPHCSFVFVGPIQTDISLLDRVPNIHFLGQKDYQDLPLYVKRFSAGVIPYLITEYTKNVYPTKLNEYLALGKPVVATDLPEIVNFDKTYPGIVRIARGAREFAKKLNEAIDDTAADIQKKRRSIARDNTWKVKIDAMSSIIEKTLEEKRREEDTKWKERLVAFYRTSRNKMLISVSLIAVVYCAVFHTPLVWDAARPLKIQHSPQRADAIVVFGGGVGESGKAAQGYEERVIYAADLYKKGYAPSVIFSSGYTYRIKEAKVMKALAEYLGIPANRIFLDEKATNTFENIQNILAIARQNDIRSLIVISSPYHMLRTSLVFKKIGGDMQVFLSPVPFSTFYGNEKDVRLRHIKGILHEYLGILYYKIKGYI